MCILFFEPLCSFYEIPAGVLRGTGHSLSPAIAAIIGTCCFRIIWIYTIFGEYCQLSVLYYAFPISWILTIVLIMIDFAIVIKNRQPLKQNFMLNCKKTMISDILPPPVEVGASQPRQVWFSFDSTTVLSICELSPCVPRLCYIVLRSCIYQPHSLISDIYRRIYISVMMGPALRTIPLS